MSFNPDAFMNSVTTEAGSTTMEPIPAGTYNAQIEEITPPREITSAKGVSYVMDVIFLLLAPDVAQKLGRAKLTIKQSYFLDLNSSGGLDMSKGKNIQLNRLREAVGQLTSNWSPRMLAGAGPLQVVVGLRPDKNNPDMIYNDIKSTGKIS